jgi:tRNA/rRNA methyltransferase
VGAIARVMKNMGLQHLVLVNPQCDQLGADALLMAVHAAGCVGSGDSGSNAAGGIARMPASDRDHCPSQGRHYLESPRTALPWLLGTAPP